MINRDNWKMTRKYLDYRQFRQIAKITLDLDRSHLRHLLEWADSVSFYRAHAIRPPLPVYLAGIGLGPAQQKRIGMTARGFFDWLCSTRPKRTSGLDSLWRESLLPPGRDDMVPHQDPYSLDEIMRICEIQAYTLTDLRGQAGAALMFLSGIRPGALVTIPISCVDLDAGELRQWPELGVATKRNKRATTYMLNIPPLVEVARTWDAIVRSEAWLLPDHAWYAHVTSDGMYLAVPHQAASNRVQSFANTLRELCQRAEVRYRRPHDLRHGHASYALTLCADVADYKAVSTNMMHSNITVTDHVYASLGAAETKRRIEGLGGKA